MRRRFPLVAMLLAACMLAGGIAWASIPSPDGTIHGCRKNSDGSLRVVDADIGQNCMNGWTSLNWNQTGPQGLAGPQGPAGPAGVNTALYAHVIQATLTSFPQSVSCPRDNQGNTETALSASWSSQDFDVSSPGMMFDPLIGGANRPTGYRFWSERVQAGGTLPVFLTCAPILQP